MAWRADILRGVRLAAIAFALILLGVTGYRMLHAAPEPQDRQDTMPPDAPAAAQPPAETPDRSAPSLAADDTAPRPQVPPPPPLGGEKQVVHHTAPKAAAPQVEAKTNAIGANTVLVPDKGPQPFAAAAPAETTVASTVPREHVSDPVPHSDSTPAMPSLGYKSLIDANPQKTAIYHVPPPSADEPKPEHKGFLKSVGKFFGGGGEKKAPEPAALKSKQP